MTLIQLSSSWRTYHRECISAFCIQIALAVLLVSSGCRGRTIGEGPQESEVTFEVVWVPVNAPHGDREIIGSVKIEIIEPSISGERVLRFDSLRIGSKSSTSFLLHHGAHIVRMSGINGLHEYSKVMWTATLPLNVNGPSQVRISGDPKSQIDRRAIASLNSDSTASDSIARGTEMRLFPIAYSGSLIKLLPLSAPSPAWKWNVLPPEAGKVTPNTMVFHSSQQWRGEAATITASYGQASTELQLQFVP